MSDKPSKLRIADREFTSRLLVGTDEEVSSDLQNQISACLNVGPHDAATDRSDAERVVEIIGDWFTNESASEAAGLRGSTSLRRRAITTRIDLAIESAPPHLRVGRLPVAARARKIATTQQCAAVERELDELLHSELPPDEFLSAIAALEPQEAAAQDPGNSSGPLQIHAILIVRPLRSRSPAPPPGPIRDSRTETASSDLIGCRRISASRALVMPATASRRPERCRRAYRRV